MLTLEQFRDTREAMTPAEAAKKLQDDLFNDMSPLTVVWVYDGSLFLSGRDRAHVVAEIERDSYTGDLGDMEATLYFYWYASECTSPPDVTKTKLKTIYTEFCDWIGVEKPRPDPHELLKAMNSWGGLAKREQIHFMTWLCDSLDRLDREAEPEITYALHAEDPRSWMEPIWDALTAFREDCIPEGEPRYDDQWSDICTAMAWIEEELGLNDAPDAVIAFDPDKTTLDKVKSDHEQMRKRLRGEQWTPEQIKEILYNTGNPHTLPKQAFNRLMTTSIDRASGPDQTMVSLHMTLEEAERLSNGLSDILCWSSGFCAALGELDSDRRPMGVETTRDLNIELKRAMNAAEGKS